MKTTKFNSIRGLKSLFLLALCMNCMSFLGQEMEKATISLSFSEEDATHIIIAKATDLNGVPIEDLELYFYIQRTFSLLPFGDFFNATDENGIVEVEVPKDIPGDSNGNLHMYVKIMDADAYEDQSIAFIKNWGIPTELDTSTEKRSLWAAGANAPLSLIVIVSCMIIAVWYIIFLILYKLFRISQISNYNNSI